MKFCFEQKDFIEKEIEPGRLAVVGDDVQLTWQEFEGKVNEYCDFFKTNQLTNLQHPVIIYGHKSAHMIVAAYAMMKMEMAYIPVDIIYPKDRIEKIVSTSRSEVIINTTSSPLSIQETNEIFTSENGLEYRSKMKQPEQAVKTNDPLVYIIFTSGSTGEPKGVQISTEAVQSFTRWMSGSDFNFTSNDVFVNTALLSFDLSVFEVMTFGKLGATLLLNNKQQTSDPDLLMDRVQAYSGTVWISTPSFALMYARIKENDKLSSLNTFLFCGEVLPHALAKQLKTNFENAKVINTYGPTEATVATTIVEITPEILETYDPLPVGRSKQESQLIIDEGEIVIVGPNVSLGYVNRPDLNSTKFVSIDGQRAFRTGDHGFLKDDMLFFHGRNDDLVKLHGYRIELNEITSVLNNVPTILHGETIALKRNGSVKKIVSLVQLDQNPISVEEIKKNLEKTLPSYMIPSDIKVVQKMPLNQNGKADKKLLTELYLKR